MNIVGIRALCTDATIIVTQHLASRLIERRIKYSEVKAAILDGRFIEDYPDDYPYPSCLILGDALHVVASIGEGKLWIITAYWPSDDKWERDLSTRKAVKQ